MKLGEIGVSDWQVVSKVVLNENLEVSTIQKAVLDSIRASIANLKTKNLYGALAHGADALLSKKGDRFWRALEEAKAAGLVKKIGVSLYCPSS